MFAAKQLTLGAIAGAIFISSSFAARAGNGGYGGDEGYGKKTNINLAVASNFYGVPPSNSAITDLINSFEAANPKYTVTVCSRQRRHGNPCKSHY